ncbi:ABC transporter ATP-binding protein [Bifidobacterium sp. M0404]|uniref:ABC transporter ATP-binding protein n=2 Tax=Bifidobacterium TaxID=1678 RepID=A0A556RBY6_9BIFI|nr:MULTISPECIES: ABC transporter ATP-binding protein [Bifidobacterium]MBI0086168.1 ABC transporter ATP-binding protein [Bifidobacterium sp. M0404]TSJ86389.1 ABC transporter ATP-binding protein [Bifidobacterium polysaccharolyticum]
MRASPPMTTSGEEVDYALLVSDLGKSYVKADGTGFRLHQVTMDLPMGYIMGLIGPNGAGKSTLIRLLLNMIRRDSGEISILGRDPLSQEEEVKADLGVVFDSIYFLKTWKVKAVEPVMAPMYPSWNSDRYQDYLHRFGLQENRRIGKLSRGMQMKLMLAVALSHDARLLILDEPTSGLDVLSRDELMDILLDYIGDGRHSVLFSTHITADLERVADFVTYINRGSIFYTGSKDELLEAFQVVRGGPDDLARAQIPHLIGLQRSANGFEALVPTEHLKDFLALASPAVVASSEDRYLVERADFDNIIRLTAGSLSASEENKETEA